MERILANVNGRVGPDLVEIYRVGYLIRSGRDDPRGGDRSGVAPRQLAGPIIDVDGVHGGGRVAQGQVQGYGPPSASNVQERASTRRCRCLSQ